MAETHVQVQFKFDGDIDFDKVGWTEYRDMMDKLLKALAAMPNGPELTEMLPVGAKKGSFKTYVRMSATKTSSVRRLMAGDPAGAPFYAYLRQKRRTLEATVEGEAIPLTLPDAPASWSITEQGSIRGVVTLAGTKKGSVWLQHEDGLGRLVCHTGREMAAELGKCLYHRVELDGLITRDAITDEITGFQADAFRVLGQLPVADLERLLQASMAELDLSDPDEFLEEIG